ncbi:MAG: hypothetical protein VB855_18645 [Pirellulaceae bacterium]
MSVKTTRWRLLSCLATVVAASLLAGCSIPYSDHPLSDQKTSTVDDRLIGRWFQIEEEEEEEDEPKSDEEKATEAGKSFEFMTVGLKKNGRSTMVSIYLELDDDGELSVERNFFYTTTINKQHYLSWQQKDEEDKKSIKYVIVSYTLDASGLLTTRLMDNDKVVAAIEQGRVDGEIDIKIEQVNGKQKETKTAHLTASPEQLQRFLLETGTDCFNDEHPMKFQFLGRQNLQ